MSNVVGSVKVTAEADASSFGKDLDRHVRAVMADILKDVQKTVRDINQALRSIDGAGFDSVDKAAHDAAAEVHDTGAAAAEAAKALDRIDSGGLNDVTAAARKTAAELDDVADEAQRADRALDDIDSGGLEAVAASATVAAREVKNVGDNAEKSGRKADQANSAMAGGFGKVAANIRTVGASASLLGGPLIAAAGAASQLGVALGGIGVLAAPIGLVASKLIGSDGLKAAAESAADSFTKVQTAVRDTFTASTAKAFDDLGNSLEALSPKLEGLAKQMGATFSSLSETLVKNQDNIGKIVDGAGTFLQKMTPGLQGLTQGFIDFGGAAARSADVLGTSFGGVLQNIGGTLSELSSNGSFEALFKSGAQALDGLGQALGPIITLLTELGISVGPAVGDIFKTLGQTITQITPALSQIAGTLATAFGEFLKGVGPALGPIAQGFADIASALAPLAGPVGQILGALGKALGEEFSAAAPAIKQVVEALVNALGPIMPTITSLFEKLAPIIGKIAEIFAAALVPVINIVGEVLAKLLPALGPLIDAFGKLVDAILPPLSALFDALAPVLEFVAGIIADVLVVAIEVVTAVFTKLAEIIPGVIEWFTELPDKIGEIGSTIADWFTNLPEKLGELAGALGSWFAEQWTAFTSTLGEVIDTAATWFTELPGKILGWLGDLATGIGGWFSQQWTTFTTGLGVVIDTMSHWFTELPGKILGWFGDLAGAVGGWFSQQWTTFTTGLGVVIDTMGHWFTELPGKIIGWIGDLAGSVGGWFGQQWDNITGIIGDKINGLVDLFTGLPGRISNAVTGLWDGLKDSLRDAVNWIIDHWNSFADTFSVHIPGTDVDVSLPHLQRLARGGLVQGIGGPTDDLNLIAGSRGEYMVQASSVQKYGVAFMDALNAGLVVRRATGGLIGGAPSSDPFSTRATDSSVIVELLKQIAGATVKTADTIATDGPGAGSGSSDISPSFGGFGSDDEGGLTAAFSLDPKAVEDSTVAASDAFTALGDTTATTSSDVVVPAVQAITDSLALTGATMTTVTNEQLLPNLALLGETTVTTAGEVINPALQSVQDTSTALATQFGANMNEQMIPAWANMGTQLGAVKTGQIDPVMSGVQAGVQQTADAFGTGVDMIGTHWQRLKEGTAEPVRWTITNPFNAGVVASWNAVADQIGLDKLSPVPINFATGGFVGRISGPGGPTSDDVPGFVRSGSFILRAAAAQAGGLDRLDKLAHALDRSNGAGDMVPVNVSNGEVALPPEVVKRIGLKNLEKFNRNPHDKTLPQGMFAGSFSGGGLAVGGPAWEAIKRAYDFARAQNGKPYLAGNQLPTGADCCLTGDTMIYGPDGATPICEVRPGHRVYSYVDGRRVVQTVTAQWFSKRQQTFKVRMRNKAITGSGNHPFMRLVRTKESVQVSGRGRGAIDPSTYGVEWVRLDELRRGDLLVTPKSLDTDAKPAPVFNGHAVTDDVAWLIGLFIGDGSVSSGKDVRICVYGDTARKAERVLLSIGARSVKHTRKSGVVVVSHPMARAFDAANQGRRSHDKRVPDDVWSWPAELQAAFLDGYCDADGHRPTDQKKHGERTYASSSPMLVADVRALHMILGHPVSNISITRRKTLPVINGVPCKTARDLHTFTVWAGGGRDGLVARKRETGFRNWVDANEFTVSPVIAVEDQGEQDTYDIEVAGAHNFVAEGVIVHNSGYMSAIANVVGGGSGLNGAGHWSTVDFPAGQAGSVNAGGMQWDAGLASGFAIGVLGGPDSGGPNGHTAGTIGGLEGIPAVNVESGGGHGNIAFGGPAAGAADGQFPTRYHLAVGGDGQFISGGEAGVVDMGPVIKAKIDPIWDKVGADLAARAAGGVIEQIPHKTYDVLRKATEDKLISEARKILGSGTAGNVESYRPVVEALLRAYGHPLEWADNTLRRMNQESSGNPQAVNLTDINAQNGTPSVGLMQVIGPTYGSWKDPQFDKGPYMYNVSTDPAANISASMRYTMNRYGSLPAGYDRAGGYALGGLVKLFDHGGWLADGGLAVNHSGRPERILTPEQTQSFDKLVAWLSNGQMHIDWGQMGDLISQGIEVYERESKKQQAAQGETTKATKDVAANTSSSGSLTKAMADTADALAGTGGLKDLYSVLDDSALFKDRTVTLTAEEVQKHQQEEWDKFWKSLQGLCDKEVKKQAADTSKTSSSGGAGPQGRKFDSGGLATGTGLLLKDVISPERVLSPAQTASFDRLVSALAGPQLSLGGAGSTGGGHSVGRQFNNRGGITVNINEAARPRETGQGVRDSLLSLIDR